jgi:hypothetical protein
VLLALSALVADEDGSWHFERNDDANNPQGTFFQSVRHLFSNTIDLPFEFFLSLKHNKVRVFAPYNEVEEFPKSLSELMELEDEWLGVRLNL